MTFRPVCTSPLGRNLRIDFFAFNPRRHRMLAGFRQACEELRKAGCRLVYLDGSFVTRKDRPGDFDACWDVQNVDDAKLGIQSFWGFLSRPRGARSSGFWSELSFRHNCLKVRLEGRLWISFQVNRDERRTERDSGDQAGGGAEEK